MLHWKLLQRWWNCKYQCWCCEGHLTYSYTVCYFGNYYSGARNVGDSFRNQTNIGLPPGNITWSFFLLSQWFKHTVALFPSVDYTVTNLLVEILDVLCLVSAVTVNLDIPVVHSPKPLVVNFSMTGSRIAAPNNCRDKMCSKHYL